jgi:predicted nucleic acid-binding protein
MRSLDAIHLATALRIVADLDAFVTYDRQLGRSAVAAGLRVESPR